MWALNKKVSDRWVFKSSEKMTNGLNIGEMTDRKKHNTVLVVPGEDRRKPLLLQ